MVYSFDFNSNDIRVIDIDGEPWFVAKEVCNLLGLDNVTEALNNFSSTEEMALKITPGVGRPNKLVSESGLYKLVMKSRKPQAIAFQNWVTGIVLPAIRKDGMYVAGEEKVATGELTEDEFILMAMEKLKAKTERLQKTVDTHLTYMTIDEFFALKHIYPG